jgi:hypothetical protein
MSVFAIILYCVGFFAFCLLGFAFGCMVTKYFQTWEEDE